MSWKQAEFVAFSQYFKRNCLLLHIHRLDLFREKISSIESLKQAGEKYCTGMNARIAQRNIFPVSGNWNLDLLSNFIGIFLLSELRCF